MPKQSKKLPGPYLFELGAPSRAPASVGRVGHPIWTENKAKLIERYLVYFVYVTRHGAYIDCFAGPQEPDKPDTWSARLVLQSEPRWLRNFYLYESNKDKVELLRQMSAAQPPKTKKEPKRNVTIEKGDCNVLVPQLLRDGLIGQKEATFCLLDQHTFECHWKTLEELARYKTSGPKIELFYFLPNQWLDRGLAAQKDTSVLEKWWGRSDWDVLKGMRAGERVELFAERFRKELGYWSVMPWPINERKDGGRIMYYMIHATDHGEAPGLMARAYKNAVNPRETPEQLQLLAELVLK